jgi:spermidine synthase
LDVVELDAEMVSVAERWFGFVQGDRIRVFVEDGLVFVKDSVEEGIRGIG